MKKRRSNIEERAWNRMRKAVGSNIWSGRDLVRAGVAGFVVAFIVFWTTDAIGAPKEFGFNSPSFNGINQSSHYLTIENQETSRKEALKQEIEDAAKQAQRDADSTTQAKFIRNVESRIYSTLSRQIVEEMFGENPQDEGSFEVDGTGITYVKDNDEVELTITDEYGKVTVITVPLGDFGI